jgi:hypothetical protein
MGVAEQRHSPIFFAALEMGQKLKWRGRLEAGCPASNS